MKDGTLTAQIERWQRNAWRCCGGGFAIVLIVFFIERPRVMESYWIAWLFWTGVSLGALLILMLHNLSGGEWGKAARPVAEAAAKTLPLMALVFLPALLLLGDLFPWAHPGAVTGAHKQAYLTAGWFGIRGITCLAILTGFTVMMGLWRRSPAFKPGGLSAAGLIVYFGLMLFASTDWVTSLNPGWYSTMFVVIFAVDHFLSALALTVFMVAQFQGPEAEGKQLHDLGTLLFAFVFFWAYVTFSQFLIIWSGNLPREISWYLQRSSGGWPAVTMVLAVVQFGVPFVLLLSRATKRSTTVLGPVALLIFGANAMHTWWLIAPAIQTTGVRVPYVELAAILGMGGLWAVIFLGYYKSKRPLQLDTAEKEVAYE